MSISAMDDTTVSGHSESTKSARFAPGQVLADRFVVVRYINRGGMGEVYEVEDRALQNTRVALKVILPEIADEAGSSRRFEQEVILARKVVHPNLCPIYDIARSTDCAPPFLFLTMKLLQGQTLSARLKQDGKILRAEAGAIVRQMVAGLAAIHAAGVIHRDIKPNNVMLDTSGEALCLYIMDFGLARLHDPEATIATASLGAGTPGYMAPEMIRGQGPSQAADLFALGVLIHQVLTGEHPYFGALSITFEPTAALEKADAPRVFLQAVKDLLSNDPRCRCDAFEELQAALASNDLSGRRRSKSISNFSSARPSRRQFAIGTVAAACAAAGAVTRNWESLDDLMHPLPPRRFVALMAWPAGPVESGAIVSSILRSIHGRLVRAEAQIKDVLILSTGDFDATVTTPATPADTVAAWGANLILAASLEQDATSFKLRLQVLDAAAQRMIRKAFLTSKSTELVSLAEQGAEAAARLLGLRNQAPNRQDSDALKDLPPTALASFNQAEQLAGEVNDTGLDAAILKYGQCLNEAPHFNLGYAKLAIAYTRKYRLFRNTAVLNLARQNAERSANLNSTSAVCLLSRALVFLYSGDTKEALLYFDRALKVDPGNPDLLLYKAQAYRDINRWPEAEQAYREILKVRPNYWPANNELGWILFQQKKYQAAADAFDAAAMAAPNVAVPLANLGTIYVAQGKDDDAVEASERSIKRSPNEIAYLNLGDIAFGRGKYKDALTNYQQAGVLDPKGHVIWRNIGDCYEVLGQPAMVQQNYAKAARLLSESLQDNPLSGRTWMTLAFYQAKIGDQGSAESDIRNAEQRGATDTESQFMKVQALALLGKKEEATTLLLTCMDRGLSPVEVSLALDLNSIRQDPRYLNRTAKKTSAGGAPLS